ncbi:LysR substrate-binding domain-containing protein [Streptomyces sp. NBC_01589]|uniref:LysR substrate-binding domain-containing protein n=1 Tax=unclassified Streptomyces TaxID=2593676 RepID=UPI00386B8F96
MVLLASSRRVLTGTTPNGEVRLDDVAHLPLGDFTPGWAIRYAVDRAFRAAGINRSTSFGVNDIVAAAERVRNDLGVCIMPSRSRTASPICPSTGSTGMRRTGRSLW